MGLVSPTVVTHRLTSGYLVAESFVALVLFTNYYYYYNCLSVAAINELCNSTVDSLHTCRQAHTQPHR